MNPLVVLLIVVILLFVFMDVIRWFVAEVVYPVFIWTSILATTIAGAVVGVGIIIGGVYAINNYIVSFRKNVKPERLSP